MKVVEEDRDDEVEAEAESDGGEGVDGEEAEEAGPGVPHGVLVGVADGLVPLDGDTDGQTVSRDSRHVMLISSNSYYPPRSNFMVRNHHHKILSWDTFCD